MPNIERLAQIVEKQNTSPDATADQIAEELMAEWWERDKITILSPTKK